MPRVSPCERTIEIIIPAENNSVIDIFQCLSIQNRKAFRQCNELGIQTVEVYGTDPAASGHIDVHRLPNTWVLVNSVVKARAEWLEQQNELLAELDSWDTRAKYRDFKMYYNQYHRTGVAHDGTPVPRILPGGFLDLAAAQAIDAGARIEWEYSQVQLPNYGGTAGNSQDCHLHAIGPDNMLNSASVVVAYAESRARPHPADPSVVAEAGSSALEGGLYTEMEDLGEIAEPLQDEIRFRNDSPPYVIGGTNSTHEFYPGGANNPEMTSASDPGVLVDRLFLRGGTALASDQTGPFSAHLGLLWFNNAYKAADVTTAVTARIVVMPGSYHGVMARDMKDVN